MENSEILSKLDFKWHFKKNDWFIELVFSHPEIVYNICILKDYNSNKVSKLVYDISSLIKEKRTELEEHTNFKNKKKYLKENENNKNIQISLEQEYILKDLIEKYKIYELIGWLHLGKNPKVFQQCILNKQKIINRIYPYIYETIEKVVGSKSIKIKNNESANLFHNGVVMVWIAIIQYLTKIDTSKVMFSLITALSQKASYFYLCKYLKNIKYKEKRMSDLGLSDSDNNEIIEDVFIDTVMNNNINNNYLLYNEDNFIDNLDNNIDDLIEDINEFDNMLNNNDNEEESLQFYENNDELISDNEDSIDNIISDIDNETVTNYIKQNILAHTFDIMSGKIKRICFDKIYAEFFFDLINRKIDNDILLKHSEILIEIMDLISINPEIANDDDKNVEVYKLLRSWMKEKVKNKLIKSNIDPKTPISDKSIYEHIKREKVILDYLKQHKLETIVNLLKFKSDCINLSPVNKEETNIVYKIK